MKTITFSLLLMLVAPVLFAHNIVKIEKKKTVRKDFTVSSNQTLYIDNEYGNVNITTWEQNKISIDVVITAKSDKEDKATEKLNEIKILFSQTNDFVKAVTEIDSNKSNWFNVSWFGNSSVEFSIDYTIKMPITNQLNVSNDYGYIYLDKLKGSCTIKNDYGGINIGYLYNSNNNINMDYSNNSTIEYLNAAKINTDYSKLKINKAEKLTINADYCTAQIGDVEELTVKADYGSLQIDRANVVNTESDYLTTTIGTLFKKIIANNDYGSLKIQNLERNFENVSINADYINIKIGIHPEADFQFNFTTDYGSLKFDEFAATYTVKETESFSKNYKGFVNQKSNATLNISSDYSSINIYKTK